MAKRRFHKDGSLPTSGEIFVFGSNLAGRHGAGAALVAVKRFGAKYGCGIGLMGSSYAIPTKDKYLKVIPISEISSFVSNFIQFAKNRPEMKFFVTRIGCGLAGYKDEQIAPLFFSAPENCSFPKEWEPYLK